MPKYDEQVIQKFADELYADAASVIVASAAKFVFWAMVLTSCGTLLFNAVTYLQRQPQSIPLVNPASVIVTLFALMIGIVNGKDRALLLKVQAQQLLVQAEIERNTRRPS